MEEPQSSKLNVSNLHGEHVLVVAVVVAVALEALADAGGRVAGATVGALADILEGGGRGRLGDDSADVAGGVEDLVEGLAGDAVECVGRAAAGAAVGNTDGRVVRNGSRLNGRLEVFVGLGANEDFGVEREVDLLAGGDRLGVRASGAAGAHLEELAAREGLSESCLGATLRLHLVAAAGEHKDVASGNAGHGGGLVG